MTLRNAKSVGYTDLPNLFPLNRDVHSCSTRQDSLLHAFVYKYRVDVASSNYRFSLQIIYNSFPLELREGFLNVPRKRLVKKLRLLFHLSHLKVVFCQNKAFVTNILCVLMSGV